VCTGLDGSRNYKLKVPPGVPVKDFWAVTVHNLETVYQRGQEDPP
jgi:hypothetical protein